MHLEREDSLHGRKSRKGQAVMINRLKFWWEVDTTIRPMGHKIRGRSNKSRGFALYTRL